MKQLPFYTYSQTYPQDIVINLLSQYYILILNHC